jgi:hypothetical protein
MPDTVYSTKVSATGGRHGSIRSDDGLLNLMLALSAIPTPARLCAPNGRSEYAPRDPRRLMGIVRFQEHREISGMSVSTLCVSGH